jgi:hypothetical protein
MAQRIVDWDQLYPGRFFKGGDILEGEKKLVTISALDLEPLEGDKGLREKGILSFEGEKQQLALNKTNGICLREMFGRKPYLWVGKRFAMFQSEWQGEPCVRVWGSPDIDKDIAVTIDLGRRRKPFKMTMHAMGDERSLRNAAAKGARKLEAVSNDKEPLGERTAEILKLMALAGSLDQLQDIEANIVGEPFNGRETRALQTGFLKRRQQIGELEAERAKKEAEDDDLPF